jgi:hypothetical protein
MSWLSLTQRKVEVGTCWYFIVVIPVRGLIFVLRTFHGPDISWDNSSSFVRLGPRVLERNDKGDVAGRRGRKVEYLKRSIMCVYPCVSVRRMGRESAGGQQRTHEETWERKQDGNQQRYTGQKGRVERIQRPPSQEGEGQEEDGGG